MPFKKGNKYGGKNKGGKNPKTLEREAVLMAYRQRTMKIADSLLDSQLVLAKGQTYLYKINKEKITGEKGKVWYKNKKPVLVTDPDEIKDYLDRKVTEGDEDDDKDPAATYYFLTTKDPDGSVIDSILDRTFGRAVQSVELAGTLKLKGLEKLQKDTADILKK